MNDTAVLQVYPTLDLSRCRQQAQCRPMCVVTSHMTRRYTLNIPLRRLVT